MDLQKARALAKKQALLNAARCGIFKFLKVLIINELVGDYFVLGGRSIPFYDDITMQGFRIRELGAPTEDPDAARLRDLASGITATHSITSYTLDPGAELSLISFSGFNGSVSMLFRGDGDGIFEIRIFLDATLEESFPTNERRIGIYSFTNSIDIRLRNPTATIATQTSQSFDLRGVSRKLP